MGWPHSIYIFLCKCVYYLFKKFYTAITSLFDEDINIIYVRAHSMVFFIKKK